MKNKHALKLCNHSEDKQATYLPFFEKVGTVEIYMCECGALYDLRAAKNYVGPPHPMTPEELEATIWLLIDDVLNDTDNQVKQTLRQIKRQYL